MTLLADRKSTGSKFLGIVIITIIFQTLQVVFRGQEVPFSRLKIGSLSVTFIHHP
jgi:hypothetical protein